MHTTLQFSVLLVALLCPSKSISATIDPNCDFEQDIEMGQEYYIYNPQYPGNYTTSRSCRWTGQSPEGTVIVLSCNDVTLPSSRDCQKDKLAFSPSGDENLRDSENYCGKTSFTAYTTSNYLAIGLIPAVGTRGGRFVCSLAAMHVAQTCACGYKGQTKIVGGHNTGVNEYSPMATLIDSLTSEAFCGATIIADRYSVTAAHCLREQVASNLGLLVGDYDLDSRDDTSAAALYRIEKFVQHPLYVAATYHNDIAIVKTKPKILFSVAVGPVCLPFKYQDYNFLGDQVTALGWGFKDISGYKASTLQEVDLTVVSNAECDAKLVESIESTQICTYTPGKDACISDSGGPLLLPDFQTGKLDLVGIISFGVGCATKTPAVNTRVTAFLSWIVSVTSDAAYCIQ